MILLLWISKIKVWMRRYNLPFENREETRNNDIQQRKKTKLLSIRKSIFVAKQNPHFLGPLYLTVTTVPSLSPIIPFISLPAVCYSNRHSPAFTMPLWEVSGKVGRNASLFLECDTPPMYSVTLHQGTKIIYYLSIKVLQTFLEKQLSGLSYSPLDLHRIWRHTARPKDKPM